MPALMRRKVCFKNSNGENIFGIFSRSGNTKAMLICHGLGSNKDMAKYTSLEKNLNSKGISTLNIDFYAHGESDGKYKDFTLTEAIDDIENARHFLKSKGFSKIGLIGASFGALAGMMNASHHNEYEFLILISPVSHFDRRELFTKGIKVFRELRKHRKHRVSLRKRRLGVKFFRDYWRYDHYESAAKVKIPVLIIHGKNDKVVPVSKSRMLRKKLRNSKLIVFNNADHTYSNEKIQKKLVVLATEYALKN
jgi:uncharacterized protein